MAPVPGRAARRAGSGRPRRRRGVHGRRAPLADGCRAEGLRIVPWTTRPRPRGVGLGAHAAHGRGGRRRRPRRRAPRPWPRAHDEQTPLVVLGRSASSRARDGAAGGEMGRRVRLGRRRLPDAVATAFRHALAQPRGPVYLFLPSRRAAGRGGARREPAPSRTSSAGLRRSARDHAGGRAPRRAERPVVVAGSAIWWDGARRQLRAFAENGRLPVFLDGSARGSLPPRHELLFSARAAGGAGRGRRGLRDRSPARPGARRGHACSSRSTRMRPRSAAIARPTPGSSATPPPCSASSPTP